MAHIKRADFNVRLSSYQDRLGDYNGMLALASVVEKEKSPKPASLTPPMPPHRPEPEDNDPDPVGGDATQYRWMQRCA